MLSPDLPIIIDVEASGFGSHSYPVEIGVALEQDLKFCTLVKPAPGWVHWSAQAEQTHRLSRELLEQQGRPVAEVAERLNTLLEGRTAYSDAWVVDNPWLIRLFEAAGAAMRFSLSPLENILSEQQMAAWHETKNEVIGEQQARRHRASFDAWVVQKTYARTRIESAA